MYDAELFDVSDGWRWKKNIFLSYFFFLTQYMVKWRKHWSACVIFETDRRLIYIELIATILRQRARIMTSQHDIKQFAAILTRYPIYEPTDYAEEWDTKFYNSRCNPPAPLFSPSSSSFLALLPVVSIFLSSFFFHSLMI
jgi:hypothetical protein